MALDRLKLDQTVERVPNPLMVLGDPAGQFVDRRRAFFSQVSPDRKLEAGTGKVGKCGGCQKHVVDHPVNHRAN
jgi:hypothetical protein